MLSWNEKVLVLFVQKKQIFRVKCFLVEFMIKGVICNICKKKEYYDIIY